MVVVGGGFWPSLGEPTCLAGVHGGTGDGERPSHLPPAAGSPSRQPLLITAYARALMNAVVSWATEPHPRECGPSSPSVYCLVQKTGHV